MGKKAGGLKKSQQIPERDRENEKARVSETRYRQLFSEMVDGFALHEIICDESGKPVDYRFLEINPAFEQLTGLKADDLIGKTVLEVMPNTEQVWIDTYGQVALTGKSISLENYAQELNRHFSVKAFCPEAGKFATLFSDITEHVRSQQVVELRMRLLEFASTHSFPELLRATLDEVCNLTNSPIGFYHFVEADQEMLSIQAWSTRTLNEFCTAEGNGLHYPVSQAGVWADCIRLKKSIIHNDYPSLPAQKGLPDGHAEIFRELVVPIFREEHIVAILGVGNKAQNYTDKDVELVTYLADIAWELVERKRAESQMQESEEKYRSLFENVPDGVYRTTPSGEFLAVNPAFMRMLGFDSEEELMGCNVFDLYFERSKRDTFITEITRKDEIHNMEIVMKHKDGRQVICLDNARAIRNKLGEVLYYEGTLTDVTNREDARKKLESQQRELERLYRASSSLLLTTSNDSESLAQSIVEVILREFKHSNCSLVLVQENVNALNKLAAAGELKEQVFTKALELKGKGLVPEAIRKGKIVNAPDVSVEENYLSGWEKTRSEMVVPLKVGKQVIGAIDLQSEEPNAFSADDERLMTIFAERAAMALERARLFEAEKRRVSRLNDLQNLANEFASLRNEQDVMNTLVERGRALANSETCTVMLLDEETKEITLVAQAGLPKDSVQGVRLSLELPVIRKLTDSKDSVIITDIDRDAPALRQVLVHPDIQAFYAFPVTLAGKLGGYITIGELSARTLSDSEKTAYELLAKLASSSLENVRLLERTQLGLQRLASLRMMDVAISSSFDLKVTLDVLLGQVIDQLQVDAVDILLHNTEEHTLEFLRGSGFHTPALTHTSLRLGEGFAGRAMLERRTIIIPDLEHDISGLSKSKHFLDEGFVSYWAVPLLSKGIAKGVLEVFTRMQKKHDQEWLDFMEVLAGQAAIAIDNSELYNNLQRTNTELFMAYDTTLEGWANALELRDKETEGHARRVSDLTVNLAKQMGVPTNELVHMRWGALLHDIGKMGIPDEILLKEGKLTDSEWEIMRKHPEYAYRWLSQIPYLRPALDIPYAHHERWDGNGYPRKLRGEQIPLSARIFAIIDVWDALSYDRPYRKAWPQEKTLEHIHNQAGLHFDPDVVDEFELLLKEAGGKLLGTG